MRGDQVPPPGADEAEIRAWCTACIAELLEIPPGTVGADAPFARLGLDSANAIQMIVTLEDRLGIELDPEIVADHPTVTELAREVARRCRDGAAGR